MQCQTYIDELFPKGEVRNIVVKGTSEIIATFLPFANQSDDLIANIPNLINLISPYLEAAAGIQIKIEDNKTSDQVGKVVIKNCLLYTSPSPRDKRQTRMPSSA